MGDGSDLYKNVGYKIVKMRTVPYFLFLLFAAFPARAEQSQLVDRVVAVVNDEAITQSEMDRYLRPLYEQLKQEYQGDALMRQLNEIRLKLLNQMIEDRLVYQESKARGIIVDEAEIDRMVRDARGQFGAEEEFEEALSGQGTSLAELRESYRRQIAIRKLHDLEIRSQVVVSPQEIEDFYKARPSELAEEEAIRVRSITVRKGEEALAKGVKDEAAKSKAASLRGRVLAGESFEKIAREFSEDAHAKEGGLVGWVARGTMLAELNQVLFKLHTGGISEVLETPAAYHLFKVEEKKTSRIPKLEEARDKIREILFQEEAKARFKEWMEELKNRAYISIR